MRTFNSFLIFLLLFISIQLNAQQPDAKYFDNLAEDMCDCIQPLMDAAELIEKYEAAGETEKLEAVAEKLDKDLVVMEACLTKLEKKYPELNDKEEYGDMAMESLKNICPEFYKIMMVEEEEEARNENVSPGYDDEYFEAAANDFCNCISPFFDTVEELEKAKKKGKKKKIKSLEKKMENELNKITECAEEINKKYPDVELNDENKTRFGDALVKNCDKFVK